MNYSKKAIAITMNDDILAHTSNILGRTLYQEGKYSDALESFKAAEM